MAQISLARLTMSTSVVKFFPISRLIFLSAFNIKFLPKKMGLALRSMTFFKTKHISGVYVSIDIRFSLLEYRIWIFD